MAEAEKNVTASNLSIADAREILSLSSQLGWGDKAFDGAGTEWSADALSPEFSPFRVQIRKPSADDDILVLLTSSGFSHWLKTGHTAVKWQIAPLKTVIRTRSRIFLPWGREAPFEETPQTKSPRALVREYSAQRSAPADIRPWLLNPEETPFQEDPIACIWANVAFKEILKSLADEIDAESPSLKFKGPPRLTLQLPIPDIDFHDESTRDCFVDLQRAANWVYENEREAELKHILLATELARSGDGHDGAVSCIKLHMAAALDGAKVAYQMSLSELGRDTLKVLADLRKAITEETAKVTETTRQLVAAIAGAIAIGLGLIAARVSTSTYSWLILSVMLVVVAYVAVVIFSGDRFIRLQRQLRKDWQPRLYRFLPQAEYIKMVETPARQAECTFWWVAAVGGGAVLALALIVICNLTQAFTNSELKSGYPARTADSKQERKPSATKEIDQKSVNQKPSNDEPTEANSTKSGTAPDHAVKTHNR